MRFTTTSPVATSMGYLIVMIGLLSPAAAAAAVLSVSKSEGTSTTQNVVPPLSYNPHDGPTPVDSVVILPRDLPEVPSGHPGLATYSLTCWDLKNHRNRGTLDLNTGRTMPSNESKEDRKKREKELERECKERKNLEKKKQQDMTDEIEELEKEEKKAREQWEEAEEKEESKVRRAVSDKQDELSGCKEWWKKTSKNKVLGEEERKESKAAAKSSEKQIKEQIKAIKKQEEDRGAKSEEQEGQRRTQAEIVIQRKKDKFRRYKDNLKKIEQDRAHKYDHNVFRRASEHDKGRRGEPEIKEDSWLAEKFDKANKEELQKMAEGVLNELAEAERNLKRDDEVMEKTSWRKPAGSVTMRHKNGKMITFTWLGNIYCDKYTRSDSGSKPPVRYLGSIMLYYRPFD